MKSTGSNDPPSPDGRVHGVPVGLFRGVLSMKALNKVRRFLVCEDGPTAVEYAVMLALILVACITIVTTLGTSVSGTFSRVNASMSS
jgi:pilus assembly protein Flp/PilA